MILYHAGNGQAPSGQTAKAKSGLEQITGPRTVTPGCSITVPSQTASVSAITATIEDASIQRIYFLAPRRTTLRTCPRKNVNTSRSQLTAFTAIRSTRKIRDGIAERELVENVGESTKTKRTIVGSSMKVTLSKRIAHAGTHSTCLTHGLTNLADAAAALAT